MDKINPRKGSSNLWQIGKVLQRQFLLSDMDLTSLLEIEGIPIYGRINGWKTNP